MSVRNLIDGDGEIHAGGAATLRGVSPRKDKANAAQAVREGGSALEREDLGAANLSRWGTLTRPRLPDFAGT